MKYFVFSDVHGCIDELVKGLETSGYDASNPNHTLLFLGDAFDKNRKDYEMYQFLKKNIENKKLIWILGNHEVYLLSALAKMEPNKFSLMTIRHIANGLDPNTLNSSDMECLKVLKNYQVDSFILAHGLPYFETKGYVFTHGFIPFKKKKMEYDPTWRDTSLSSWHYFNCMNGMKLVSQGVRIPGKTLVCGHIGTYYGYIIANYPELEIDSKAFNNLASKMMRNSKKDKAPFGIYYGDGVIGIDGRCYDTGNVNVLVVEDEVENEI